MYGLYLPSLRNRTNTKLLSVVLFKFGEAIELSFDDQGREDGSNEIVITSVATFKLQKKPQTDDTNCQDNECLPGIFKCITVSWQ
jgi:hypothetical protein